MKLWQILAVVALGVLFGLIAPDRLAGAVGPATLYVFLPALLFEAAWNLNLRAVGRQWRAIALLAGPGVLLTALIVAGALVLVRVPFGPALLAGAILSATDPVAVVAVFRRVKVPRMLAAIVECESLFNDAVAVTIYRAVLVTLAAGSLSGASAALVGLQALWSAAGGVALGIAISFAAARTLRRSRSVRLQIAATALCAYGAYFVADALRLSGIFATIACGMGLRYFERSWLTLTIAQEVERLWGLAALLANGVVFFLVGAALQIERATAVPLFAGVCILAVALSRVAVAGLLLPVSYPRAWIGVVRAAGLRGALSLALALALPRGIPYREAIVDATFAVALVTLAAAGLALGPAVRRAARQRPSGYASSP